MGFQLVPKKSVTSSNLKWRNGCVVCFISPNLIAFMAHCVKVVEDTPTHSAGEM